MADAPLTPCPKCGAPCTTKVEMRGGDHGWGTTDAERTTYRWTTPSPPVAAVPATPVDSELWAILIDVNSALEDGVDALSEVRSNFREAYKGHRPEEHAAKERDLLNAEAARAKLAEYMDRPRPAAQPQPQPQPQPAQPLTGAAPIAYSLQWPGDVELGRINISTTFDTEKEAREYADGCLHAETIRVVALVTAPSTPTPEVAP